MADDNTSEILTGIMAYLRAHFPDVEFSSSVDEKTRSVILQADGRPRYRLSVTQRFLDGEDGVTKSLDRLREWNVAVELREAKSKLVTLATTGLHTSNPPLSGSRPPRR
jgi:hypothetical protein